MSKVPNLRFKKFKEDWKKICLKEVSEPPLYGMNAAAKEFDGFNKYIRITDIDDKRNLFLPNPLTSPNIKPDKKYKLDKDDLLFARTGASVGKTYLYNKLDGNLYFAGFLIKFKIIKGNSRFVFYQTLRKEYNKWVIIMSMRSGQPGINANEYGTFSFYAPNHKEQNKIATFMYSIDNKINLLEQKLEYLKLFKRGMINKEYFNIQNKNFLLKNAITEYSVKNKNLEVTTILSITNSRGFIEQKEMFSKNVASSDISKYKVINKGYFGYNPSRVNVGSIDLLSNFKEGVLSPIYVIFKTDETVILSQYLIHWFKSNHFHINMKKYIEGGVRDTLSFKGLSSMHIYKPSLKEQKQFIKKINHIQNKIILLDKYLQDLKQFTL